MSDLNNTNWSKQFEHLKRYSEKKKGYTVLTAKTEREVDFVDLEKKVIAISEGHTPEMAFYCLLHELGHVRLQENKAYKDDFQRIWEDFTEESLTNRITLIHEELDAWREGLKIAKERRLKVNRHKYEILKAKYVSSFLPWVSKRMRGKDTPKDLQEKNT